MDRGFRFLCKAETTRLVSFVGIAVAIVLMFQYSELPTGKFVSSVTTKITSFRMDTSLVNSKVEGNDMHLNGSNLNSKDAVEENAVSSMDSLFNNGRDSITAPAPEKAIGLADSVVNFTTTNDGSPMSSAPEKQLSLTSQGAASPQPMVPSPNRTSLDSETDSRSPVASVTSAATSVKSNTTGSVSKDGKSGSLQGSSNMTVNNGKPVSAKNFKRRPSKVVSISEMNLLLQINHAYSQQEVCLG